MSKNSTTWAPAKPHVSRVLQLKITLEGSSPLVWRRILVPVNYSFFDLHVAIQDAMGWTDSHLHGFHLAKKGAARPIFIQYPSPEHKDMLEWLCLDSADEFDPTAFDPRKVEFQNPQRRLKEYQRRSGV